MGEGLTDKVKEKTASGSMETRDLKILVVEDDATMQEVLKIRLQQWGFKVFLAPDVAVAKEQTLLHEPDIVVSDVVMPEISGLELLADTERGRLESSRYSCNGARHCGYGR